MWWMPDGILPLLRMRIPADMPMDHAMDLLVCLDMLKRDGLADHPEITRMAMVELAYGGPRVPRLRWMAAHRADTLAYGARYIRPRERLCQLVKLCNSSIEERLTARRKASFPGDKGYQCEDRWDGTMWAATPTGWGPFVPTPLEARA